MVWRLSFCLLSSASRHLFESIATWQPTAGRLKSGMSLPAGTRDAAVDELQRVHVELQGLRRAASMGLRQLQRVQNRRPSLRKRTLVVLVFRVGGDRDLAAEVAVGLRILGDCAASQGLSGEASAPNSVKEAVSDVLGDPEAQAAADQALSAAIVPLVRAEASRLVAEGRLVRWLREQNHKGVAPSCDTLVHQLAVLWRLEERVPQSQALLQKLRRDEAARKKWGRRFREFWHITWRKLPARAPMTDEKVSVRAGAPRSPLVFVSVSAWSPCGQCRLPCFVLLLSLPCCLPCGHVTWHWVGLCTCI